MTPHGNDPAFPVKAYRVMIPKSHMTPELLIAMKEVEETMPGLTKREEFAKAAMQGMMSLNPPDMMKWTGTDMTVAEWVAGNSIMIADALLAALHKTEKSGE